MLTIMFGFATELPGIHCSYSDFQSFMFYFTLSDEYFKSPMHIHTSDGIMHCDAFHETGSFFIRGRTFNDS
jgi:hypothetical protein